MELVEFDKLPKLEDIQEIALDDPIKIFKICQEMEIICNKENGIGLSAVQVGLGIQLFIVKNQSSYEYYANCKYVGMGEKIFSIEGCLSIRDNQGEFRRFELQRFKEIKLTGFKLAISPSLKFENIEETKSGLYSIVFQHEIDHSYGTLISDIGKEVFVW
jgi:peptide deformylase